MKIFRFIPHIISAASFFLIIYVAYKFFIFHEGEYFYYYKKYFIIMSIIFLMSLLLFFTSEILRKIFFLSLVSSIIALYLVETVMVLQLKNSLSKKLNDMSDKRSKIEVILSLKKKGIEIISKDTIVNKTKNFIQSKQLEYEKLYNYFNE